ncbi:50S ribosomal subunit maturation GTPase RbgA [Lentilactobacillus kosonis]|uniref:50S ribosomal subunit maturation GTPase RbgA n=1 Tax=Lentilactobacillus kosonis TaxID=2810561 RepID=A0A401FL44_9LACO|nr:50S ribosomal subunit maturation GTPase RbgA [Lentilactobacillus kosonis]
MGVNIQWFPGHMAKAIRQFEENISLVDVVFEILDARIPLTSMNPEVKRISGDKPHLYIMTKRDLADEVTVKEWLNYLHRLINQQWLLMLRRNLVLMPCLIKLIRF